MFKKNTDTDIKNDGKMFPPAPTWGDIFGVSERVRQAKKTNKKKLEQELEIGLQANNFFSTFMSLINTDQRTEVINTFGCLGKIILSVKTPYLTIYLILTTLCVGTIMGLLLYWLHYPLIAMLIISAIIVFSWKVLDNIIVFNNYANSLNTPHILNAPDTLNASTTLNASSPSHPTKMIYIDPIHNTIQALFVEKFLSIYKEEGQLLVAKTFEILNINNRDKTEPLQPPDNTPPPAE